MKNLLGVLVVATFLVSACDKGLSGEAKFKAPSDSTSYAIGLSIGKDLSQNMERSFEGTDFTINHELLAKGIYDVLQKKEGLTDKEVEKVMAAFQKTMMEKQMSAAKTKGAAATEKGAAFRAQKEQEGYKKTASGLLYRVITEGNGKTPAATSTVRVHYEGKLIDGKVFDSSIERGEPIEFSLGGVIPGWTEGLQLMKEGAKYELIIPSELAYGEQGAGKDIGPGETLIFNVELIKVVK